jgi:hypothetical protein
MYVSQVTFSERNDARPTYWLTATAIVALLIDATLHFLLHIQGRELFCAACLITLIATSTGIYCLAGCVWHPIPPDRRQALGMTSLHLSSTTKFQAVNQDEIVDASQTEMRDQIQWQKMLMVSLCITLNSVLLIFFAH